MALAGGQPPPVKAFTELIEKKASPKALRESARKLLRGGLTWGQQNPSFVASYQRSAEEDEEVTAQPTELEERAPRLGSFDERAPAPEPSDVLDVD